MERFLIYKKIKRNFHHNVELKMIPYLGIEIIIGIIYPFIYKYFIDNVLNNKKLENLNFVVLAMIIYTVSYALINYAKEVNLNRYIKDALFEIRNKIFSKFLNESISSYNTTSATEMKYTLEDDVTEVQNFFETDIVNYIVNLVTILLLFVAMTYLSPALFLCCMIFWIISYFQTQILRNKVISTSNLYRKKLAEENDKKRKEIYHYREIKSLILEEYIVNDANERYKEVNELLFKQKVFDCLNFYLGALNHDLISRFFIYMVGGILIVKSDFMISSFIIYLSFYQEFIKKSRAIIGSNLNFNQNKGKLHNIMKFLEEEEINKLQLSFNDLVINFENVDFKYDLKKEYILRDFNYDFYEKNKYIIKGRSGIGKSTIAKLIFGEIQPANGSVKICNTEVIDIGNLYENMACATADSKIFNTSIWENLVIANPDANKKEVIAACEKALIYDFIKEFPEGFDTIIGENGIKLSGGQRQRLVLGRIFLKKACIYILDEALSEIGIEMERKILNNLFEFNTHALFIVITHRNLNLSDVKEIIMG